MHATRHPSDHRPKGALFMVIDVRAAGTRQRGPTEDHPIVPSAVGG